MILKKCELHIKHSHKQILTKCNRPAIMFFHVSNYFDDNYTVTYICDKHEEEFRKRVKEMKLKILYQETIEEI